MPRKRKAKRSSSNSNKRLCSFSPFKSTIFTYPMSSGCLLTECSVATESAFFRPSIRAYGHINNNHIATLHPEEQDICTRLSGEDRVQLSERARLAADDSMFICENSTINGCDMKHSAVLADDCTIDINQEDEQESLLSLSRSHHRIVKEDNSNSMEAAVKMVQPIVDIIFTAFEEQLKHVQSQSSSSSSSSSKPDSNYSSPSSTSRNVTANNSIQSSTFYLPYFSPPPSLPPVTLHAVSFNIQLSTKQRRTCSILRSSFSEQRLSTIPSDSSSEKHYPRSISLLEFKHKTISSSIPSKNPTFEHILNWTQNPSSKRKFHKFKRLIQLAAFGVSILCGYLFS